MRVAAHTIIATVGIVDLIGPAFAADMTGTEIKSLLSGKTAYFETTAASSSGKAGQAVIYFAPDGTALFKTPTGAMCAWHMGGQGQYELYQLEGKAGNWVHTL
jgi:hypothetical protein